MLTMKVVGAGWLSEENYHEPALRFALGRPGVSAAVLGMNTVEQVEQNVRIAREARKLTDDGIKELMARMRMLYEEQTDKAWFIKKEKRG